MKCSAIRQLTSMICQLLVIAVIPSFAIKSVGVSRLRAFTHGWRGAPRDLTQCALHQSSYTLDSKVILNGFRGGRMKGRYMQSATTLHASCKAFLMPELWFNVTGKWVLLKMTHLWWCILQNTTADRNEKRKSFVPRQRKIRVFQLQRFEEFTDVIIMLRIMHLISVYASLIEWRAVSCISSDTASKHLYRGSTEQS